MGKILYVGTFGSDDPTRATLPFLAASGALDQGHEPVIFLIGEAVYLAKDEVIDSLQGVGFPPVHQLVDKAVSNGVPLFL
jgi:uncharacterized protein involved in oxidation of intracellular sulfur